MRLGSEIKSLFHEVPPWGWFAILGGGMALYLWKHHTAAAVNPTLVGPVAPSTSATDAMSTVGGSGTSGVGAAGTGAGNVYIQLPPGNILGQQSPFGTWAPPNQSGPTIEPGGWMVLPQGWSALPDAVLAHYHELLIQQQSGTGTAGSAPSTTLPGLTDRSAASEPSQPVTTSLTPASVISRPSVGHMPMPGEVWPSYHNEHVAALLGRS